ncbi:MAG TPA: sigma 54-interacting transcriptional regulator [Peptococcaceae bacterium]|nr:sigma 54-interacting transcriptional regulator [Peptococcaceae bacterium]
MGIPKVHQQEQTFIPDYFSWTKERWEGLIEFKKRFLEDSNLNPLKCPYLREEVARSWLKSRELGIDPKGEVMQPHLSPEQYKKVLEDNSLLISITKPIMDAFRDMAILSSGYILYMQDYNGVFLLQQGDMLRRNIDGLIWDVNTIGTCAHSLCMELRRPIHIMGPEHYSLALMNIMAAAAPIADENGKIIATLILGQPTIENPCDEHFLNLCSHTLGLVTSLASAVEAQYKLNKSNEELKASYRKLKTANRNLTTAHLTLETTFSLIDEGIITIDEKGKILNFNQEGARILKLKKDEAGKKSIQEFLCRQSNLMPLVLKGNNIDIEETLVVGNDEHSYFINIRPVINKDSQEVDGAILRLTSTEKLNAIVASRSGGIANYTFDDIIGENPNFKKIISLAKKFARSPDNILITGESGTGKDLFAQAIHNAYCPQGPYMVVNCAAMPRELIESELFGYEGGSFTGAERSGRPGKIELAHGGTLFLDEVGDMPLEIQAVLLRVLEDKQVMRVGGRRYKKVDFRLIAATNKDLYEMVKDNQFREDLYFRLSVLNINILPLRERKEDIKLYCKYFIENYCQKLGWKVPEIEASAQKIIDEYDWPGNVRQLQNAMIYAVNSATEDLIKVENLPGYILFDSLQGQNNYSPTMETLNLENLEKEAIKKAMSQAKNYVHLAAQILGISRSTLYRKLKYYNIEY